MGIAYDIINQVLFILGVIARFAGVIVFGLGLGWFTLEAFKRETQWYYQAVLLVVFFGFFAAVFWQSTPAVLGGLALGTGLAFLLWGRKKNPEKQD